LKTKIAKMLELPVDTFKLCKSKISGEFKDFDVTVEDADIFDGGFVHIELGKPRNIGEVRVSFFVEKEDRSTSTPLNVPNTIYTDDLRRMASETVGWEFVRLREKMKSKKGKILVDGKTLKESIVSLKDGTEIWVEKLEAHEYLKKDELLLDVQQFNQSTGEFSETKELVLSIKSTIGEVIKSIADKETIDPKYVLVTKPMRFQMADPSLILELNWDADASRGLISSPWYLGDGDVLLWKDVRLKEMTGDGVSRSRPKEKALKIHTYDEMEEN